MGTSTWFVSDLHLSAQRPAAVRVFFDLLERAKTGAEAVYLLGDVFDAWVGDDDLAQPLAAEVASALAAYSSSGGRLYVMHGNRDFLMGERFCLAAGAKMLGDPHLADLYGTPTVLMHGDLLCTEDVRYQTFRNQVRDPAWQAEFLRRPLAERYAMAAAVRRENEAEKSQKTEVIMDVTEDAVQDLLRRFDYPRLIHGHTHRPARHVHRVDGHDCERWVLADWYRSASYLACTPDGCRTEQLGPTW